MFSGILGWVNVITVSLMCFILIVVLRKSYVACLIFLMGDTAMDACCALLSFIHENNYGG